MSRQPIDELANENFQPEKFADEYRNRVLEIVEKKVEGGAASTTQRGERKPAAQSRRTKDAAEAPAKKTRAKAVKAETAEPAAEAGSEAGAADEATMDDTAAPKKRATRTKKDD